MTRIAEILSAGWPRSRASRLAGAGVLVACVAVGAAVGAGTHPGPADHYRSQQVVSVTTSSPGFQPVAWRTFTQTLDLPEVRSSVAQLAGVERGSLHVGTLGDPNSSLITVYADGDSAKQATTIVSDVVSVVVGFLQRAVYPSPITRSTFEGASEGWDTGAGLFVVPPTHVAQVPTAGRGGSGALSVSCPVSGCGPYLVLNRVFERGTPYIAVGWVNARPSVRERIVLGASPTDVMVGPTKAGNSVWQPFEVRWTPVRRTSTAIVAFQVMSTGGSNFLIDDVAVGPQSAFLGTGTAAGRASYTPITSPVASSNQSGGNTAAWASVGAATGLLAGVVGLTAANLMRARRSAIRLRERSTPRSTI